MFQHTTLVPDLDLTLNGDFPVFFFETFSFWQNLSYGQFYFPKASAGSFDKK